MNTLLYYEICFIISIILTLTYIYLWHDGIDVTMTCLFVLLPIVNLGCVWMFWAPTLEIAILANKIVYLAGCFWPPLATKAILSLCRLKIKKIYTMLAFILSMVFYAFALMTDRSTPLYRSISYEIVDGRYELYPEYGWMHTVIYAVMALYIVIGIIALVYAMKNVVRASIKNMWIMLIGEIVTVVVFFIYGMQKLAGSPAILYVVSLLIFLIAGYRSYYYDIDASVMDTMVTEGKMGYLTFDKKKCLLGCNKIAESFFPELKSIRTDKTLDNLDGVKAIINDCLNEIEKNSSSVTRIVPSGEIMISIKADLYHTRGKKDIYRIIMEDDTDHQNLISLLNREKEDAVQEKEHVSETFHRYIDPNVADKLLNDDSSDLATGEERNITVLFADIRGFTSFSENRPPREVLDILNMIMESMTSCIMADHGIVDKIIGDCVMALWLDSENKKSSPYDACSAALNIQRSMRELNENTLKNYGVDLHIGIGINYGTAIVGNVGTEKRSDYTAIGDAVNVASRLESMARPDEILVTSPIKEKLTDQAEFTAINSNITLRGRTKETSVFRLEELI